MAMRNDNHGDGGIGCNLIVFAEAAGMVKPPKSALRDPTPAELFPRARLDFFGNIRMNARNFADFRYKSSFTAHVAAKALNGRILLARRFRRVNPGRRVMDVRRADSNRKDISCRIRYDMPLAPFRFFPPSIPRSSLG